MPWSAAKAASTSCWRGLLSGVALMVASSSGGSGVGMIDCAAAASGAVVMMATGVGTATSLLQAASRANEITLEKSSETDDVDCEKWSLGMEFSNDKSGIMDFMNR